MVKKQDEAQQTKGQGFGVFQKGETGPTQVAATIEEAVHYRFEGWTEIAPADPEKVPEMPATPQDMGLGLQAPTTASEGGTE